MHSLKSLSKKIFTHFEVVQWEGKNLKRLFEDSTWSNIKQIKMY